MTNCEKWFITFIISTIAIVGVLGFLSGQEIQHKGLKGIVTEAWNGEQK
jgi:hypothetical protein